MLATPADEAVQAGRDAFIAAQASRDAVKNTDARASIGKKLAGTPEDKEHLATRDLVKKRMKKRPQTSERSGGRLPSPR